MGAWIPNKEIHCLISRRRFVKPSCHTLYDSTVWGILVWTIFLYIKLCILCTLPIPVCLHPSDHSVFPFPYGAELNRFKCFWKVCLECFECIITVVLQIFLDFTTEKLNKVEFTVELWQEDAQVPSSFNDFLNTGFLFQEIRLLWKKPSCTAINWFDWADLGFFAVQKHPLSP